MTVSGAPGQNRPFPSDEDHYQHHRDVQVGVNSGGGGGAGAALLAVDVKVTEVTGGTARSHAITALDQIGQTFTVTGDVSAELFSSSEFRVAGSTGNDGVYTVQNGGVSVAGGNTTITTVEAIPDATADGHVAYTIGTYSASVPVAAGSNVIWFELIPLAAPWGGQWVRCNIADSIAEYLADNDGSFSLHAVVSALTSAYDAANPASGSNFFTPVLLYDVQAGPPKQYGAGTFPWAFAAASDGTPPGVYYLADDTITVTVVSTTPSPPIVPSGVLLVRFWLFGPQTPTDATFA